MGDLDYIDVDMTMNPLKSDLDSFITVNMEKFPVLFYEKDIAHIRLQPTESKATLTISSFLLILEKTGAIQLIDEL